MTETLEDVQTISVDKWGTLNTAASSARLPEGHSPNNQNVWTDEKPGSVVTANGYTKLGENPSGNPTTFLANYYKTSDGTQTVVLSDGQTVWKTTDYLNFTSIKTGLSPFFQLRGAVIRGKLWMTNGSDPVMTYDGTTLTVLDGSASTPNVPLGKYIKYHDERVWIYGINGDLSSLRFTDLANSSGTEIEPDNSAAWPTDNEIQVSEGDDDIGTGLFLYRGYLYASKSYSIWRIVGYDEYTYTRVKTRSSTGTRYQESVAEVDNLVHFIGADGLYTFDGEESKRISDIIDPASSDEGVFAFRNLQQSLVNNQFWNVTDTADFVAGTVPAVLSTTGDKLSLVPADTTQADFEAGAVQTNVDTETTAGAVRLATKTSGTDSSIEDLARDQGVTYKFTAQHTGLVGSPAELTDGSTSSFFGFSGGISWQSLVLVNLSRTTYVPRVDFINLLGLGSARLNVYGNTGIPIDIDSLDIGTNPNFTLIGTHDFSLNQSAQDYTYSISAINISQIAILFTPLSSSTTCYMGSCRVYSAKYEPTGSFISKTIDYLTVPFSFGTFAASTEAAQVPGHSTISFFTQSSVDGVTWDIHVPVANGGIIQSNGARYLRWGADFTSDGADTHVVYHAYVGGTYISAIHNTGGSILQWGAFEVNANKLGQTVDAYYRAAATSGGVLAASWTAITPGSVPNTAITNVYIQIKLELATTNSSYAPYVNSHTVNWIYGTAGGINTLQNVASFVWLNRYWLSAATLGATANDIVLVKGKATYGSPFHKKDFAVLSFARFQDYFIAGSSTDGSIYRMEYGYSKDGEALDAFYETGDYTKPGAFMFQGYEIVFNGDRTGPYTVSIGISIDGGITYDEVDVDLTRATSTTNLGFTKKLNVSFMGDKFRLRVRNNAADQPFTVDGLDVFYRLLPSRGSLN